MIRRRWVQAGSAVMVVCMLSGTVGAATDEERAGARAAAAEGQKAFDEGRFADAVDFFTRAESLVHAIPHLVYLGRSYAKLGKLVKAREAYLKAKREQLPDGAPGPIRAAQEAAASELPDIEARLARITIVVENAGTKSPRVAMDGATVPSALLGVPYPTDPGTHTLVAEAEGMKSAPVQITLAEGGQQQVVLKLEASSDAPTVPVEDQPGTGTSVTTDDLKKPSGMSTMRLGSYIGFGVGAVGLALGTIFLIGANSDKADADSLFNSCKNAGCTSEQQVIIEGVDKDADAGYTRATIGYVVGGVGIAAGATLLVLDLTKSDSNAKAPSVTPWVGLGSAGVSGRF